MGKISNKHNLNKSSKAHATCLQAILQHTWKLTVSQQDENSFRDKKSYSGLWTLAGAWNMVSVVYFYVDINELFVFIICLCSPDWWIVLAPVSQLANLWTLLPPVVTLQMMSTSQNPMCLRSDRRCPGFRSFTTPHSHFLRPLIHRVWPPLVFLSFMD